jgi:hypothetical protein
MDKWFIFFKTRTFLSDPKLLNSSVCIQTLYSVHCWSTFTTLSLLGMMLQAWHTCIWRVSHILLCRYSQALSGWMGSIAAQLFSGLQRCTIRLMSEFWLGHSRTVRLVTNTLLRCLGFVLRVLVPMEGEFLSRFSSRISVLFSVHLCLDPD